MENNEMRVVSAPVQTVVRNPEPVPEAVDPMEELNHGIDELRGRLKLLLDENRRPDPQGQGGSAQTEAEGAGFHPRQTRHRTDQDGDLTISDRRNTQPKGRRPDRFRPFLFMEVKLC